ncbi:MAG TPA: F0F1 ATP synthase subunit delta [Rhodospirillaceae bacterium]|nr:F0F1 ATP synthase subunit delta [Rhodospirillaceae bacterium]
MSSTATGAIADRYSSALFDLADEASQLDAVAGDLRALKAMIAGSADLARLVRSPVLGRVEQQKAVAALAKAAAFNPLVGNFLGLVAKNRRLFAIDAVIDAFLARLAAKRGEVAAHLSSAIPLSEAQVGAVTETLRKAYGGTVVVHATVDPGLLGGLVVKVGSRMVDNSLKTKLQHLKLAMKGVG